MTRPMRWALGIALGVFPLVGLAWLRTLDLSPEAWFGIAVILAAVGAGLVIHALVKWGKDTPPPDGFQ